jgi:serine/threonine protein kinase
VDEPIRSKQDEAMASARSQAAATRQRAPLREPQAIGPWNVVARIGSGGMGIVYLVEHQESGQVAALKVLRPGLESASAARRFAQEIEILQRLEHPAIAKVYDAGVATIGIAPCHYYAMEYVPGYHLVRHAEIQRLSVEQKLDVFARVCDAVAYAHDQGVLHRDLKPHNILIEMGGGPKVMDFGVARLNSDGHSTMHTELGQMLGTVQYMPPEQILGLHNTIDATADVYALGVVLYELVFGTLPYEGSKRDAADLIRRIREGKPEFPAFDSQVLSQVQKLILIAMSPQPEHRYANSGALALDVRRALEGQPIQGLVIRPGQDAASRRGLGPALRRLFTRPDATDEERQ